MLAIEAPFPQYFDLTGAPLTGGYLYFGAVGANPQTSPITVYWDAAGTQPAAQPIRTVNGYIARAGTPARLYVGASYSLTVRDSRGQLVVTSPDSADWSLNSGATYPQTMAGGETLVTVGAEYVPGIGNLAVYLNGIRLLRGVDYAETNNTQVTFTRALDEGDEVEFIVNQPYNVANNVVGWAVLSDFGSVHDAVAHCIAFDKWLYWDEDATVTANVVGFHSVKHFGPGALTRGTDVWTITPIESTTLTLYVNPTGSNTNDGLTAALPLQTVQQAFNIIKDKAPLSGRYVVRLAAGTYTENVVLSSATMSDFPIDLRGPDVTHPTVPTAVIAAANTNVDVMNVGALSWFRFFNVRFTGATTQAGIVVNNARLTLSNVHVDACLVGVTYQNCAVLTVTGGIYTGLGSGVAGGVGFLGLYNSAHDIGGTSALNATQVTAYQRGLLVNEGAQGHLDYTQVSACVTGLNIKRGAGACNTDSMSISGCTNGVLVENNGWYNNNITFASNTINVRSLGGSPELVFLTATNAARTLRLVQTTNIASHTGTVSETLLYTSPTVPNWVVSQSGHTARVTIYGTASTALTAGTVVTFYLATGSETSLGAVTIPQNTTAFKAELLLWHTGGSAQRAFVSASGTPSFSAGTYTTTAVALKDTDFTIRAKATLANTGNSILFAAVHLEATYGG